MNIAHRMMHGDEMMLMDEKQLLEKGKGKTVILKRKGKMVILEKKGKNVIWCMTCMMRVYMSMLVVLK